MADGVIRSTAASFAENIGTIVSTLELAGASNIVVWNVRNLGDAPATRALGVSVLATAIASSMNLALPTAIGEDPHVKLFDAFGLLNDVIDDPGAYGLSNVTDACAQFVSCDPSRYLFWDGIHPTSAANPIISKAIFGLHWGARTLHPSLPWSECHLGSLQRQLRCRRVKPSREEMLPRIINLPMRVRGI